MAVETITFAGARGRQTHGWLCRPAAGQANGRGVLVIHEILGLIDNIKPILQRFAANGYTALAPDLFDTPDPTPICVAKTMAAMQAGRGTAVDDLDAALDLLQQQPGVEPGRLGAAGFCMGGGFAMLMGLDSRVRAVAPYYGVCPVSYMHRIKDTAPAVVSYGGRDLLIRNQGRRLHKALQKCGAVHDFKEYSEAGHSFMTVTPKGPWTRFAPYTPLRAEYVESAAEDSWRRMLAFFGEHI